MSPPASVHINILPESNITVQRKQETRKGRWGGGGGGASFVLSNQNMRSFEAFIYFDLVSIG